MFTQECRLRPWQKRRFPLCTNERRRNQVSVADITYIKTGEGWLYLAGILDASSRRCGAGTPDDSRYSHLVTRAWHKGMEQPAPRSRPLLHHSDRGIQYASAGFRTLSRSCGGAASMSCKANCYDHAMLESFWATLTKPNASALAFQRPDNKPNSLAS